MINKWISFGQGRHGHQKDNQFLNSTIMPALFIYHFIILPINLNRKMIPSRFHLIRVCWACSWGLSRPCSDAQAKATNKRLSKTNVSLYSKTNVSLYSQIYRLLLFSPRAWARRLQRDSAYRGVIIESHDYRALNGRVRHPLIPLRSPRPSTRIFLNSTIVTQRLNWVTHIPMRAWNSFTPYQSLPFDHGSAIILLRLCKHLSIYDLECHV